MGENEQGGMLRMIVVVVLIVLAMLGVFTSVIALSHHSSATSDNTASSITTANEINDATVSQKLMKNSGVINLDIARHPMSVSELKQVVDQISKNGFTQLSLNMGDNTHLMYQSEYLKNDDSVALSIDDIRLLVSYANSKDVYILPGLDSPGHAGAILTALQSSHPDVYAKVKMDAETLDYTNAESQTLLKKLYEELLPAFDGQSQKSFLLGADEVPGNDDTIKSLTPYLNNLGSYLRGKGYNTIIWNDAIIKSEVPKLSSSFTVWYWAQGGHHNSDYDTLVKTRASVKDFTAAGFSVVNANDYANTYQIKNIGNSGDESYFLNYLKNTTTSSRFNEIVDGQQQWWTEEPSVGNDGMIVSLWGEDSGGISNSSIISFLGRIQLPDKK